MVNIVHVYKRQRRMELVIFRLLSPQRILKQVVKQFLPPT